MGKKRVFVLGFLALVLLMSSIPFKLNSLKASSEKSDVTSLNNNDQILSENYLDFYAISSSNFIFTNNGGEDGNNKLENAFDRNFNTCFKSGQDNNVSYVNSEKGEKKDNFINYIDINFNSNVCINRILYGAESSSTFRGYPTILNIYAQSNGSLKLLKTFNSTETTNMVVFNLGENVTTSKIRFEYVKVSTKHKYVASAREIMFLQPQSSDYDKFNNMFTDYCELTLSHDVNTISKLTNFENKLKSNINYNSLIKPKFDRARQVLSKELEFDTKREFSTKEGSTNVINRYGDIDGFCRNTLKMSSFGTNRQVSGICVKPYQKVTIYVDCLDNDPIPTVRFSQNHGHWSGWLSGNYQLKKGKNVLTVPYLKNSNYTIDTVDGGAIYIVNPYDSREQSENVKLYIESGDLYPVYRKGQDENQFLSQLNSYYQDIQNDPSNVIDITEIVTDHIIFSGSASKASEVFSSFSPKQCALNWDSYLDSLLSFGGMDCNENGKYYNPTYKHINANVRVSQPWAGAAAYAYTEHIGIYTSWEATGYYAQNFGWGMSHELGHMLDTRGQIIGESTNNMYAKFNETALEKIATRGDFDKTFNALSSDENLANSYFNENRLNFLIWWYIESYQHGFWADLQNCYRDLNKDLNAIYNSNQGLKEKVNSLSATEKQVFYASVVTKIDMSYYYDRWGFNLTADDSVFKQSSASSEFKECFSILVSNKYITNTKQPKLWYQDNLQFNLTLNNNCSLYNGTEKPVIAKAVITDNGTSLFFRANKDERHLGYEVLVKTESEDFKVIAFTKTESYLDTNSYISTVYYKIRAVDRMFNTSDYSNQVSAELTNQSAVCKIGDTYYNSLSSAVSSASENDIIEIVKNTFESNFVVDKNLTIKLSSQTSSLTIYKNEIGNFITINSGITLTILGSEQNHLVIDGGGYEQNGSLFNVNGVLVTNYVDFVNNKNAQNGGVVIAGNGGNITIQNSIIKNNSALNGGVFYLDYASNGLNLKQVNITQNSSKQSGGVLFSKGLVVINNCSISSNKAETNGVLYNYAGGILKINNSTLSDNNAQNGGAIYTDGYTELINCTFSKNYASNNGGAIYYSTSVAVRELILTNTNLSNNSAVQGKDIFLSSGKVTLNSSNLQNGQIYVLNGNLIVNSTSNLSGQITIKQGLITLKDKLFNGIENVKFSFVTPAENVEYINFQNFELNEQDLSKFKTINNNVKLMLSNNTITLKIVEPKTNNFIAIIIVVIVVILLITLIILLIILKKRNSKKHKKVILK